MVLQGFLHYLLVSKFALKFAHFKMEDKVSNAQLEDLAEFLSTHPNLAKGIALGPRSNNTVDLLWNELAQKLNNRRYGATKTGVQWKKYWIGYKHRLKTKAANCIRRTRGTGSGLPSYEAFAGVERKLLRMLGEAAMNADTERRMHSFPSTCPSSPPPSVNATPSPNLMQSDSDLTETMSDTNLHNDVTVPQNQSGPSTKDNPLQGSEDVTPLFQKKSSVDDIWVMELEQRCIAAEEKLSEVAKINTEVAKINAETVKITAEALKTMAQGQVKILETFNKIFEKM